MDIKDILSSLPLGTFTNVGGADKPPLVDESELRLKRLLLENIPAFIHIIEVSTGKIVWRNREWERLFAQFLQREPIDIRSALQAIIHPDDYELLQVSEDYFTNGKETSFGGVIRVKYPGEDSWSWLVGISRVIQKNEEGRPQYTLAVFLDFTAATRTESQIGEALREVLRRNNKEMLEKLTNREKQIIQLLVMGYSNSKIAKELYISHHTVESHRKNIRIKLSVSNTSELISLAKDLGI